MESAAHGYLVVGPYDSGITFDYEAGVVWRVQTPTPWTPLAVGAMKWEEPEWNKRIMELDKVSGDGRPSDGDEAVGD